MRLPTYRSSHGRRHHPYPQSKRNLARRISVIPVHPLCDEVSASVQVPLLDAQQLDVSAKAASDSHLVHDSDSSGGQARIINLLALVLDLADVLKRKYFT